jgi:hypothetical protein
MAEDKNTITVPVKLVTTKNVLITLGVTALAVGLIVIFYPKSKIGEVVKSV